MLCYMHARVTRLLSDVKYRLTDGLTPLAHDEQKQVFRSLRATIRTCPNIHYSCILLLPPKAFCMYCYASPVHPETASALLFLRKQEHKEAQASGKLTLCTPYLGHSPWRLVLRIQ